MTSCEGVRDSEDHVFLSPHFDDAVLSCGGLIHRLVRLQKGVRVVTVFGGSPEDSFESPLAAQLRAEWKVADPVTQRANEDRRALTSLGVSHFTQWSFRDAVYRSTEHGQPLYACWEEVFGAVARADSTERRLAIEIDEWLASMSRHVALYVPLSLGHHVDHQILFRLGLQLRTRGHTIHFYEDWPYADAYSQSLDPAPWTDWSVSVDISAKSRAAVTYTSQLPTLGGSARAVRRRLEKHAYSASGSSPRERYWTLPVPVARKYMRHGEAPNLPFTHRSNPARGRGVLLPNLTRHSVDAILPPASGTCLEFGVQDDRHRALVESKGYSWRSANQAVLDGDADAAPYPVGSPACATAAVAIWRSHDLHTQPEAIIAEAARVLMPGGVFCAGMPAIREYGRRSPHTAELAALVRILRRQGFRDIEIRSLLPGALHTLNDKLRALLPRPFGAGLALMVSVVWLSALQLRSLQRRRFDNSSGAVVFVARKAARDYP
ncbi:MAG: PIG-L family deacetylase [Chloroflexota bacterium]